MPYIYPFSSAAPAARLCECRPSDAAGCRPAGCLRQNRWRRAFHDFMIKVYGPRLRRSLKRNLSLLKIQESAARAGLRFRALRAQTAAGGGSTASRQGAGARAAAGGGALHRNAEAAVSGALAVYSRIASSDSGGVFGVLFDFSDFI